MKKRFFCLLLVLVLMAGLLPMNVLADADKPDAKFDFILSGEEMPEDTDAALVMKAGDDAQYYATKQTDPNKPDNWYLTPGTDAEWNVKFEYPADGIPTITLKDAKIVNKFGLWFGGINIPMTSDVKVVVEGDNHLEYLSGTDTVFPAYGSLMLRTTGTTTVTGTGKLDFASDHHSISSDKSITSGVLAADGDIILDNVEIFISMPETKGKTNGICSTGGDIIMKGGSLTIVAYDDPETLHDPGKDSGYRCNQEAIHSAVFVKKREDGTGGNFTVQDGAEVLIMASPFVNKENKGILMFTEGTFTIKDSTVEIGLVGKIPSGVSLFDKKPTLEFANDTYTITATKSKYPGYEHGVVALTPAEDKLVDFLADDVRLTQLTYFKVTPGGPGGPYCELPEEEPTEAPEPAETQSPEPTQKAPEPTEETKPEPTTAPTQAPEPTEKQDDPTPAKKGPSNGLVIAVVVICVLAIAASGFALYWFVFRPNKKK